MDPPDTVKDGSDGAVRHLQDLHDPGRGSIFIKILVQRLLDGDVVLGDSPDEGIGPLGITDQGNRLVPPDRDGIDHVGEQHCIPEGQDGQGSGKFARIDLDLFIPLHDRDDVDFSACGKKEILIVVVDVHNVQKFAP